jgi:hypothetical protein
MSAKFEVGQKVGVYVLNEPASDPVLAGYVAEVDTESFNVPVYFIVQHGRRCDEVGDWVFENCIKAEQQ